MCHCNLETRNKMDNKTAKMLDLIKQKKQQGEKPASKDTPKNDRTRMRKGPKIYIK